ncbi:MAG: 50S ribosomal protein L25 [Candidatus Berkelbacteria bacterium]|nr:50S ribosomal protein L25 [Candidatus Berkelbacteria bacterium]MCR4307781.1 50S ribosomal protein L25 [Candidatus Berkelbacteria bacterium]
MESVALVARSRELTGKKVKNIRLKGEIPGVVYGHGLESTPITVERVALKKAYAKAGSGTLVDLTIGEQKPIKVLFHEPQVHYLNGEPIHFDLYAVKMDEEIETTIPIVFVGISPAVDELEGNFIANRDELTIKCLPGNLIPNVEVDISVLKTFDDSIKVSDIQVPETVQIQDEMEETVALVTAPRSEEELEAELAEDKAAEEAAVGALGEEAPAAEGEEGATAEGDQPATSTEPAAEKPE